MKGIIMRLKSLTFLLVVFNVLFFTIVDYFGFLEVVAVKPNDILELNSLYTVFTCMFMHANWSHLIVNMITLMFLGYIVEICLGQRKYLIFYFVSGIIATLFYVFSALLFPEYLNVAMVGASGAIFGLIGFIGILFPESKFYLMLIIPINAKYAGWIFLIGIWILSASFNLNIGNWAHLGGFLSGICYGLYLRSR